MANFVKQETQVGENSTQDKLSAYEMNQNEKLRQCMYKRIAQGHALVDIEDTARREWGRR